MREAGVEIEIAVEAQLSRSKQLAVVVDEAACDFVVVGEEVAPSVSGILIGPFIAERTHRRQIYKPAAGLEHPVVSIASERGDVPVMECVVRVFKGDILQHRGGRLAKSMLKFWSV